MTPAQPPAPQGEDVEALAEVLSWATGEFTRHHPDAHPDHNRWAWSGDGHGAPSESNPLRDHFRDVARAILASDWLAAHDAEVRAGEREQVLRETADAWTQGEWSNVMLPKPTPPAVPVIAYANRLGDWLRARAERTDQ